MLIMHSYIRRPTILQNDRIQTLVESVSQFHDAEAVLLAALKSSGHWHLQCNHSAHAATERFARQNMLNIFPCITPLQGV